MTINERVQMVIDSLCKGNKRAFANLVGISATVVENIVGSRKGKPSFDVLCKICSNANISEAWLLTGNGSMLKSNNQLSSNRLGNEITETPIENLLVIGMDKRNKNTDIVRSTDFRPRIPFDAAAGALSIVTDSIALKDCEMYPVITAFPRYDFTMPIHGDSMEPEFLSGDEVACQIVNEKIYIQWGRVHILDTIHGAVIKRIYDDGERILCKSINPLYADFSIPKEDILHIALVVGMLRRY